MRQHRRIDHQTYSTQALVRYVHPVFLLSRLQIGPSHCGSTRLCKLSLRTPVSCALASPFLTFNRFIETRCLIGRRVSFDDVYSLRLLGVESQDFTSAQRSQAGRVCPMLMTLTLFPLPA